MTGLLIVLVIGFGLPALCLATAAITLAAEEGGVASHGAADGAAATAQAGSTEAAQPHPTSDVAEASCAAHLGPKRAVVRVIDGETVLLDDLSELRLAGLIAPDPPDPGLADASWPPARRARLALERLVLGRSVALRTEINTPDRYGRGRAQLYLEGEGQALWVQGRMVEEGSARVEPSAASRGCIAGLLAREDVARRAGRGLWSQAAYAVRPAWKSRELEHFRHSFQIVEGEVVTVAERRKRVFINFGRRWSSDFTVTITGRDRKRFTDAGIDLAALAGRRVRVRGWIESWNGPLIRASEPGQIELLDSKPRRAARKLKADKGAAASAASADGGSADGSGADGSGANGGGTGAAGADDAATGGGSAGAALP